MHNPEPMDTEDTRDDELQAIHAQVDAQIAERGCSTDDELRQEIENMNACPSSGSSAIHRNRKSADGLCLYESSVSVSQIPSVVARLDAHGMEGSYAVFTLETPGAKEGQGNRMLNFQYAILDGIVGLEWPLIRQSNIEDKQRVTEYLSRLGCKVTERVQQFPEQEFIDLPYLRVDEGDIVGLGIHIATGLYRLDQNTEIALLVDGFEKPELKIADVMRFVRESASQEGFIGQVERISSVLRLIHGRTSTNEAGEVSEAFAELKSFAGFVRFTDVVECKFKHTFWSNISAEPRTQKLEKEVLGAGGINLLTGCGYHRVYTTQNNYENWFSIVTDEDFGKLAEFCVGLLHMLFDHQPGHPLEIDLFVPCLDLETLPKWHELTESLQEPYRIFMRRFHGAMARFHNLMSIGTQTPSESQKKEHEELCLDMEDIQEEFPSWIAKLMNLLPEYGAFYSYATDNQTELMESQRVLHRLYNGRMLNYSGLP